MAHVFVSYIHENEEQVLRLCGAIKRHGIKVWLDRNKIKPGAFWKEAIRDAIANGDFFLACFSEQYATRNITYMNEELIQAIDQLRMRPINREWFIPILLSECEIPAINIGGGKTLRDIQWVPLYADWDMGVIQIISVINSNLKEREEQVQDAERSMNEICDEHILPFMVSYQRIEKYVQVLSPTLLEKMDLLMAICYDTIDRWEKEYSIIPRSYFVQISSMPQEHNIDLDIEVSLLNAELVFVSHPWPNLIGTHISAIRLGQYIYNEIYSSKIGILACVDRLHSNPYIELGLPQHYRRIVIMSFKKSAKKYVSFVEGHISLTLK